MGNTALITGASSGFGREFAEIFAQNGHDLLLIARHEDELNAIAEKLKNSYNVQVAVLAADLSQEDTPRQIFHKSQDWGLKIDYLINNAGIGEHGLITDNEWQKIRNLMQINMISLVHLTKLFLPGMLERGHGRILNLASTLSLMPSPKMAVYGASKAFVLSFTEALSYELKDTGVSATALLPGASDTEFFDRADAEETRVYKQTSLSDPEKVAKDGYEAMMEGKARVVSGMQNKVQAFLSNFLPDSLLAAGINKLMEETPKDQS